MRAARRIGLPPGAAIGLRGAPGMTIELAAGRVWLTQAGDPADHFLHAGDSHLLRAAGLVVIECDGRIAALLRVFEGGGRRR